MDIKQINEELEKYIINELSLYKDNKSRNVVEFVNKVMNNKDTCKKAKYCIPGTKVSLPADTLFHDEKHKERTPENWQLFADNIFNIFIANKASRGTTYDKEVYHIGIRAEKKFLFVPPLKLLKKL